MQVSVRRNSLEKGGVPMPIVIKAKKNQSTNDVIRQFKKAASATDIVQKAKDRRYFIKPSQVKAQAYNELRRIKKRYRSLKKMKNVAEETLIRFRER